MRAPALGLLPPDDRLGFSAVAAAHTSRRVVFAWAGATGDAVVLLEELATKVPGLGPAEITRDPLFAIPLANNARCKALEQKLEAQIAANQTLF